MFKKSLCIAVLALAAGTAHKVDAQGPRSAVTAAAPLATPAEDSARAIHLLNRATFGVRPGDVAAVLATGRDAWLEKQLHPDRIRDTISARIAGKYPAVAMPMADLFREYARPPRPKAVMAADTVAMAQAKAARDRSRTPQALAAELIGARLERAVLSDRQLEEVMTDFWFNHFNVFVQKGADRYLIGDYETNAIRAHVFGRFEDLLVATAQHPAMLFYLDNWQSVYVDPTLKAAAGRRQARMQQMPAGAQPAQKQRERGLNENYARELLELHTLGVDGGYTQADVVNVARALTGWSFDQPRQGALAAGGRGRGAAARDDKVGFVFRPAMHDRGEKVVLGHKLAKGRGLEDGKEVLHILATHPSTAKFISGKLVEYFVTDKPSPELVNRLAAVFERTNGDLREVTRALFSDPAFYAVENRRAKVKTPYQLVVSSLRATNAQVVNPRGVMQTLKSMGHLPYMSSAPTGYPATSEDWVNSGAMLARMNYGIDFAAGKIVGVRPDGRALLSGIKATGDGIAALRATTDALLPGVDPAALQRAIVADASAQQGSAADTRARAARMVGLVIGSPEFQRH